MLSKYRQLHQNLSSQGGYTILEGLMAILVVSVLVSALGPVVAFSVGTRVQAKRIELATQAAKSYIDGVKSGEITRPTPSTTTTVNNAAAPTTGSLNCPNSSALCTTPSDLYCVNFDENNGCQDDSSFDLVVQGIAYDPNYDSTTNQTKSYDLGVRVYRANSFASGVTLKQPTTNEPLTSDSLTTNAIGDNTLPLVIMKTEVLPSDSTFQDLKDRLN